MDSDDVETTKLSPDDAFSVLGNDTRVGIIQALAESDAPLPFSELRDRVGISDSGQFNYHLDKLTGHFIRQTDEGYALRQAGKRVIEAVLSGAVTETVLLEPTRLDASCPYCGADVEVSYGEERLLVCCTECPGSFSDTEPQSRPVSNPTEGRVTMVSLPSAGFRGRSPRELLTTATAWTLSHWVLVKKGVCSRCSGKLDTSVDVCPDHESDGGICDRCNTRFAVRFQSRCTNCIQEQSGAFSVYLLGDHRIRSFFESRGIDTLGSELASASPLLTYEEELLGTNPFEARFTFTVDGDTLSVTVDDDLSVVDITEHETTKTD